MLQEIEERREKQEMKGLSEALKLAGNIVLSMVTAFSVAYWLFKTWFADHMYGIIAGVIASLGMFMVESILIVIRGTRIDNALYKMRRDEASGITSPFGEVAPSAREGRNAKQSVKKIKAD